MTVARVHVGFGRASLWGTWRTDRPLADEIDVCAMVAGAPGEWAALAVADVCGMWPSTCLRLRQAVAEELQTDVRRVGIFCTQNHGAPMEGPGVYDAARWLTAFRSAASAARGAARPARMAGVDLTGLPPGVFCRRLPWGGLGSFTFWYGFRRTLDGRAACGHQLELALRALAGGLEHPVRHWPVEPAGWPAPTLPLPPVPADVRLGPAADALLQGVFFRTPAGEPIGALARWAAHPVTANAAGGPHSGDYPAHLRRGLRRGFGGGALFLTGPCGDQAPLVETKSVSLAEQTGAHLAGLLLRGLTSSAWRDLTRVCASTRAAALPLRQDYPSSVAEARRAIEDARVELRLASSLAGRKHAAEEIERLGHTAGGSHYEWCGFRPEHAGAEVSHPLFALSVEDRAIVGLPGEPFGSYSLQLRTSRAGPPPIVVEECNGYLSYIPGARDYAQGGYGSAAAILSPAAEGVLLRQAGDLLDEVEGRSGG